MADFLPAFEKTILKEGGYQLTNIADDRGGQTYAGISRRSNPGWPGWEYIDRGDTPSALMVRTFYLQNHWDVMGLTAIESQMVAQSMFDFGVNTHPLVAAKLAQLVVGATPDGKIGPVTTAAINAVNVDLFMAHFALAKVARYRDIVRRDKTQLKFLLGWINRTLDGVVA